MEHSKRLLHLDTNAFTVVPLLRRKKNYIAILTERITLPALTRGAHRSMVAQIRRAVPCARAFKYLICLDLSEKSISVILYEWEFRLSVRSRKTVSTLGLIFVDPNAGVAEFSGNILVVTLAKVSVVNSTIRETYCIQLWCECHITTFLRKHFP